VQHFSSLLLESQTALTTVQRLLAESVVGICMCGLQSTSLHAGSASNKTVVTLREPLTRMITTQCVQSHDQRHCLHQDRAQSR